MKQKAMAMARMRCMTVSLEGRTSDDVIVCLEWCNVPSRSHALRGNVCGTLCVPKRLGRCVTYLVRTGRRASGSAFPRRAWERGKLSTSRLVGAERHFRIVGHDSEPNLAITIVAEERV